MTISPERSGYRSGRTDLARQAADPSQAKPFVAAAGPHHVLIALVVSLFLGVAAAADFRLQVFSTEAGVPVLLRPRVGLALSGGASKLFFELGFLAELESIGIPIDALAGTSGGAIVGSYYAYGYSSQERHRKLVEDIDWPELFRDRSVPRDRFFYRDKWTQTRGVHIHFVEGRVERLIANFFPEGLTSGQKMYSILTRDLPRASLFKETRLDRLFTPLATIATRVKNPPGGEFRVYSGRLAEAVRASVVFPILLPVYFWRENEGPAVPSIDGGVVNNIPVDVLSNISAGQVPISKSLESGSLPVPELSVALDVTRPLLQGPSPVSEGGKAASVKPSQDRKDPASEASNGQQNDWLMKFVYGIDFNPAKVERKEEANRQLADVVLRLTLPGETVFKLFDFSKQRSRDLHLLGRRMLTEELPIEIQFTRRRLNGKEVLEGPRFLHVEHLYELGRRSQGLAWLHQKVVDRLQEEGPLEEHMERFLDELAATLNWPAYVRRDMGVLTETKEDSIELTVRLGWLDLKEEFLHKLNERADRLRQAWTGNTALVRIDEVRIGRNPLMDQSEFHDWLGRWAPRPERPLATSELQSYTDQLCEKLDATGLFKIESVDLAAQWTERNGNDAASNGQLAASLVVDVRARDSKLAQELQDLRNQGYALAALRRDLSESTSGGFHIQKGPTIRQVRIAENKDVQGRPIKPRTDPGYVLRNFESVRGKTFNAGAVLDAVEETYRQGLYHIVKFQLERVSDSDNEVDLLIETEERPAASINLAARYDMEENYTLYSRFSFNNLRGRGGRLFTDALYGRLTQWRMGVELPIRSGFFGQSELWHASRNQEIYRDGNAVDLYHQKRTGLVVSVGQWLRPSWWHNFGYRLERVKLNDEFQSRWGTQLPVGDGRVTSWVYRQSADTLDSFPYATTGFKFDLTLETSRKSWGSRYHYNRLELDLYKPVALSSRREQVLNLRSFLGLSSGDIPVYELFGVGGARENPLLGFNRRELLGKKFLTFNLSHRFLLYRLPFPESRALFGKLYWGTFADTGFVSDVFRGRRFGDFRHGYGVGLLLDTNFGLIKLLYGINSERKGQLYVSLAYEI